MKCKQCGESDCVGAEYPDLPRSCGLEAESVMDLARTYLESSGDRDPIAMVIDFTETELSGFLDAQIERFIAEVENQGYDDWLIRELRAVAKVKAQKP